jgi:sigma-B regulation protein RsbU (phosphoserine phosphatase)
LGFVHVDRGAALIAYTDGVIEREDAKGRIYGLERLGQWLRGVADAPSEDAVAGLMTELRDFGGGTPFEDDVTILMVRRT